MKSTKKKQKLILLFIIIFSYSFTPKNNSLKKGRTHVPILINYNENIDSNQKQLIHSYIQSVFRKASHNYYIKPCANNLKSETLYIRFYDTPITNNRKKKKKTRYAKIPIINGPSGVDVDELTGEDDLIGNNRVDSFSILDMHTLIRNLNTKFNDSILIIHFDNECI
ncbi:hypothetical protein OAT18_03910 [Tenacibaculum sp.]|nr:hypothetical protein [Tenacibaculum sp.]